MALLPTNPQVEYRINTGPSRDIIVYKYVEGQALTEEERGCLQANYLNAIYAARGTVTVNFAQERL
jgi:hypothetical protein